MSNEEIDHNDQENSDSEAPPENFGAEETSTEEYTLGQEKQPMGKGSVVMFIVLAAAGAGTYLMYARTGPQTANAADPKAQQVISQFMTNRDKNLGTMRQMLQDTEARVKQFLNYSSVKQIPLSALSGNPFRMTIAAAPAEKPHLDEEAAKKKHEEERQTAKAEANKLLLQSIMSSGAHKSCMINNTLYTEGQKIDSFVIEKINTNGVIVRTGVYRFNVPMQH